MPVPLSNPELKSRLPPVGNSTSALIETVEPDNFKFAFPVKVVPALNSTVELVISNRAVGLQLIMPLLLKAAFTKLNLPCVIEIFPLLLIATPSPKSANPEVDFEIVPRLLIKKVDAGFPLLKN